MSHAVQQRQYHRPGSHGRGEGLHGGGEIVGFAAQQDEIERPLARRDRRHLGGACEVEKLARLREGSGQRSFDCHRFDRDHGGGD